MNAIIVDKQALLVLDQWQWKARWSASNSIYSKSLRDDEERAG